MKEMQFKEKYPIFTLEVMKSETKFQNIDAIFEFLIQKIQKHPIATYIATFDHMAHTKSIRGETQEGMIDAKNLIFCFGKEIPTPKILAVRPRSIGIAEYEEYFDISILEVPNENLHQLLEGWIKEIAE